MLLIVPVALAETLTLSLIRVAAFTLGIVVSMAAYGLVAGRVLERAETASITARRQELIFAITTSAIALFCVIAGIMTVAERLQG